MALVFESYVPPNIEGQWMEVSIGGKLIRKLDAKEFLGRLHTVVLPTDLPGKSATLTSRRTRKTMSTETDKRKLSVLFSYIGLVPTGWSLSAYRSHDKTDEHIDRNSRKCLILKTACRPW